MGKNYAFLPEAVTMYTQTEALKEVKDMSENLVSGDFEREYRGRVMMDKQGVRRQTWLKGLAVAVGAIAVWLVVLTVVREIQLANLRREVDQLTANMIAMSANVKSLNQKLSNNRMYNEFKTLEDTIYADEDQSNIPVEDTKDSNKDTDKQNYDSLEKLQGLTVLEDDDDLADDEDMYDGEDGDESGDWYQDYDKRREKIGTTNMVRLKPSDFTSSVVSFGEDIEKDKALLRDIKRTLNENPESDVAIPTMSSTSETPELSRGKRSVASEPIADSVDQFAAPRIVAKSDESRRKTKKVPSSTDASLKTMHTVSRTVRNSDIDERRPFIAAHFHGNTSHLSPEIHEHYKGNGLVRVAHEAAHDVWYPSPWTIASPHPRPTLTRNGHVHVHHTGVYLVYVQIYYLDSHDVISWVLHRTNADIEGRETLLQCAQSSHSSERLEKPNSCFSSAALFLKAGDRLAVRNTGGDRHSLMQPEKSFIGLIKLADAEDPNQEF